MYKGSEPRNDADYRLLQSKHIKYIVDMKFLPARSSRSPQGSKIWHSRHSHHHERILCLLSDKRLRPVYFHCTIGRDRTALIATLYEVYFLGLPPEKAQEEMRHFGFKETWALSGLRNYLENHAGSPWGDGKHTCKRFPLPSLDK